MIDCREGCWCNLNLNLSFKQQCVNKSICKKRFNGEFFLFYCRLDLVDVHFNSDVCKKDREIRRSTTGVVVSYANATRGTQLRNKNNTTHPW